MPCGNAWNSTSPNPAPCTSVCHYLWGPHLMSWAQGREMTVELLNYRQSGERFWNLLSLMPVRDCAGNLMSYIGVQSDITELIRHKEAEHELQVCTLRIGHRAYALLTTLPPCRIGIVCHSGWKCLQAQTNQLSASRLSPKGVKHWSKPNQDRLLFILRHINPRRQHHFTATVRAAPPAPAHLHLMS